MNTDTPETDLCVKSADRYGDRDVVPATIARQLKRELDQAKELMKTAAIWIEACPFENSIPLGLKLRNAAMPEVEGVEALATGSATPITIADAIAEYKATRGTSAVNLLHKVLDQIIGLRCPQCGEDIKVTLE
jgi:hypothetical protein